MIFRALRWLALLLVALASPAAAHEVRPAYLQIQEVAQGRYQVLWKQPAVGEIALRLVPHLSNGMLEGGDAMIAADPAQLVKRWDVRARQPIEGVGVSIDGLSASITDVLVVATRLDGKRFETILTPERPTATIGFAATAAAPVPAYLRLGVEHILTGVDHLCFVLGLLLLIGLRWRLVKAITAFTVAHSLTLTASALGIVHVPPAPVEALVALSILFLAVELVAANRGQATMAQRRPWVVAFTFGLLHGFAFAGALADIGLPEGRIPAALFLFNVGVETGQLLFIAAVGMIVLAVRRLGTDWRAPALRPAALLPAYALGGFASFWLIERTALIFTA